MLDNFPHIKAYWVMLTEEVASVALNFGADDMDGTVGEERIAHDAGAVSPMKLAKDQIVRLIRDAGKIPVERDVYYNPLRVHSENVIGKIPYLNSLPFYHDFEKGPFRVLPIVPRRMGILAADGQLTAGLFSLMDYFRNESSLDLLDWCIATRDQVKSVMLFSNHGWADLDGRTIGVTDETATSIQLLRLLLENKYGVKAVFSRLHAGVNDYSGYDAVLLIGDQALYHNRHGLEGYELVYDLAAEWYDWKKMPFVFAVWAVSKKADPSVRTALEATIRESLSKTEGRYRAIGELHGKTLRLPPDYVEEYLEGFNYTLGDREKEAMREFRKLAAGVNPGVVI